MSDYAASKENRDHWGKNEMLLVLKWSLCYGGCTAVLWITAMYEDALTAEGRKVPFFLRDRRASAKRSSKLTALSEQKGRNQEGWGVSGTSSVLLWSSSAQGWCFHLSCPLGLPGPHQPRTIYCSGCPNLWVGRGTGHLSCACTHGPQTQPFRQA